MPVAVCCSFSFISFVSATSVFIMSSSSFKFENNRVLGTYQQLSQASVRGRHGTKRFTAKKYDFREKPNQKVPFKERYPLLGLFYSPSHLDSLQY